MMKIFVCDTSKKELLAAKDYCGLISRARIENAFSYRKTQDKLCCLYAELAIRYALMHELNLILSENGWKTDFNGKPYIEKGFFNLSHAKQFVVCAADDKPLGIDIQDFTLPSPSLCRKVLCEKEQKQLSSCQNPDRLFTAFWTQKESYLKAKGTGITVDLADHCCTDGMMQVKGKKDPCFHIHTEEFANEFQISLCTDINTACKFDIVDISEVI